MHAKRFARALSALALAALCVSSQPGPVEAQAQTATLTITNTGPNTGSVGVQPGGNVCNPQVSPGGSASCEFTYPVGTPLRVMANSPATPGIFTGTGDAQNCATSVCEFTLNADSSITATFDAGDGPFPALTINLLGDGAGNVGSDNNQCQNFELGFSACTVYYGAGSSVVLQGRSMPGNIFERFSGGTVDAMHCTSAHPTNTCTFTLSADSAIDATFSKLSSVAIEPNALSINAGTTAFFNARATFTNGSTRLSFNGNTPWMSHLAMDVARFSAEAAVVGDRLYAIGGVGSVGPLSSVEVFDPLITTINQMDQVWTPRASLTTPRESFASAVVGGTIYAIGGHTTGGGAVETMEFYDPQSNAWLPRASMPGPRARMAAAVINDTIYVVGGSASAGGGSTALNTVEAYDASDNSWLTPPPPSMQVARDLPAAATVNGKLYVIGGDGVGTVESYDPDPAVNQWTTKATMPNGGGVHRAAAINGLIYAVGGVPMTVKVYNPALDSWAELTPSMPLPLGAGFALAAFDGRLFAAGGQAADSTAVATVSANRPPEATWWSHNSAVGRVNTGNNGSVRGEAVGTATITARLVDVDSSGALLTVTSGGGGGANIFLGIPNAAFTTVGEANWGCGTFGQNAEGPWEVKVNYGDGGGDELTPHSPPPAPCGGGPNTKGWFFFNHAYAAPGAYQVAVTVRNTTTNASATSTFTVEVQDGGGGSCAQVISTITAVGTVPFDRVQVAVFDRPTGDLLFEGELPIGFFDEADLPAGQYRLEFSVPAGYVVTPSSVDADAVCGQPINLNLTVQAAVPPPTIAVESSPGSLWPPNHKMVTVNVTVAAPPDASIELVSITSNEPGVEDDYAGAVFGSDDRSFQLRAERLGGGEGRIYTITYRATNAGGSTTATTTVVVPHDQGKKK